MSSSSTRSSTFSEEEDDMDEEYMPSTFSEEEEDADEEEEDDTDEEYISTLYMFSEEEGIEKFLAFLAFHLQQMVEKNEMEIRRMGQQRTKRDFFDCAEVLKYSLFCYIMRLMEEIDCSPSCYLVAYIYLGRLCRKERLLLDSLNVHRLLFGCVVVAIKFWENKGHTNKELAEIGRVLPVEELNELELDVLFLLGFELLVTREEFVSCCDDLQRMMDAQWGLPSFRRRNLSDLFFSVQGCSYDDGDVLDGTEAHLQGIAKFDEISIQNVIYSTP